MVDDDDEISPLAMSIMGSIAYGGEMPRHVSFHEVAKLSDYEAAVIDRAIRKRGLTLWHDPQSEEFIIEKGYE